MSTYIYNDNRTPLHLAAIEGHIDIVRLLLEFGAEVDSKDKNGETAEELASKNHKSECLEEIRSYIRREAVEVVLENRLKEEENVVVEVKFELNCGNIGKRLRKKYRLESEENLFILEFDNALNTMEQKRTSNSINRLTVGYFMMESLTGRTKLGKMGKDGFGSVFQYKNTAGSSSVMKMFSRSMSEPAIPVEILAALKNTASLNHPHILSRRGLYHENRNVVLVETEMMQTSLGDLVRNLGQDLAADKVRRFSHQILEGLKYLHSCSIVHGSLKCNNVLLERGEKVKLVDFGLIRVVPAYRNYADLDIGWCNWMAPEAILDEYLESKMADVWSFGATLWEMTARKQPFYAMQNSDVAAWIVKKKALEPLVSTTNNQITELQE